jgi:hypothetical protein
MDGQILNLETLVQQLDWPIICQSIAQIEQIDGKAIGDAWFEAGVPLQLFMPHFFLPFGANVISDTIGLYLHPQAIANRRIPVAALKEEGFLMEIAPSLSAYLQYLLIQLEAYHVEDGDNPEQEMAEELAWIGRTFGDFYTLGQYGNAPDIFNTDQVDAIMIEQFGGSPHHVLSTLRSKQPLTQQIQQLEQGIAVNPRSLALYARLAQVHDQLGNPTTSLQTLETAFACYYHTEYWNDLQKLHHLADRLLNQGYTNSHVIKQRGASIEERVAWIVSVYQAGDFEYCVKLLDDLCYEVCTYSYGPICDLLKQLYQQLGWSWLLPLMDQRRLLTDSESAKIFTQKNLSSDWDGPLRSLMASCSPYQGELPPVTES